MKLFGHRSAADDMAALENCDRVAGARQIKRADERVVTAADDSYFFVGGSRHCLTTIVS
jgi:tRNA threonylcarbamoyladenosine modification (KEOPS) complex Cgi121 subunit